MSSRHLLELPPELKSIREKWLQAKREEQDLIYAREFGPAFVPLFAKLPLEGWSGERPHLKALISVLGLSWQPVALMAAWVAPEHVLLLGTRDSLDMKVNDEEVLSIISRLSGIPHRRFAIRQIDDAEELAIYREVRDFVKRYKLKPHEIAVDPTGGKKSMSASAALAGFLSGAWIVYVDYSEYHPEKRIPIAGTEYPRLLRNPLEVFGELEFDRVRAAYRSGSYEEACHLAEALASRLYEPREAEALALVCKAYGSWDKFDFASGSDVLNKAAAHLERFAPFGRWSWAGEILPKVREQCQVIGKLAELATRLQAGGKPSTLEESAPLVLNHLASAERYLNHQRLGAAVLLTYATLERYVDLALWVHYGLDDEGADYSKVALDLRAFHEVGRKIHGKNYQARDPGGALTLGLGVQLLATLRHDLLPLDFAGRVQGLMRDRNRCEFEHGLCSKPVTGDHVVRHIEAVKRVIEIGLGRRGDVLEAELERYRFPQL